jgi:hypothetical protein
LDELMLSVCGCTFVIRCGDAKIAGLVAAGFRDLIAPGPCAGAAVRHYEVERLSSNGAFHVRAGETATTLEDEDDLLFFLDNDVTIALQHARKDLFFLHAGTVAYQNRAVVFPAYSGAGKSTLTLALVAAGFEYLSAELAPIDLRSLMVEPYPHALCLKRRISTPLLPSAARRVGVRIHVSMDTPPAGPRRPPVPVRAVVFPYRNRRTAAKRRTASRLEPLSAAFAVARLLAHSLNSLAHRDKDLDAAMWLSQSLPCFQLDTSNVDAATAAIATLL